VGRVNLPFSLVAACFGLSTFFGCAHSPPEPSFRYKFYVIESYGYKGPDEARDLPLEACHAQGSCIMMQADEFFRLKTDYQQLKFLLINEQLKP